MGGILAGNEMDHKRDEQRGIETATGLAERYRTMKRAIFATLVSVGIAAAYSVPASAQGASCAERNLIVDRLSTKYGETRQSAGLNQNNGMVEVFASDQTGTWTILVTMPNGMSCLMAAGKAWQGEAAVTTAPDKGA